MGYSKLFSSLLNIKIGFDSMRVKPELPILKLQPIRIPSSWKVDYNTFVELDPKTLNEKMKNGLFHRRFTSNELYSR